MDKELIQQKFRELFFKLCIVDKRAEVLEDCFLVSYQQGIIDAQKFFIDKLEKNVI